MLPDPLHPAVVHIPVALAVLLPLVAVAALAAIERGWLAAGAWSLVILLSGVLVLGSWLALETGEEEGEHVERVVAEQYIEAHEEAAEAFMAVGVVLFLVVAAGALQGRPGRWARIASVPLALVLLAAGVRVGHLGGELVYEHGAAAAHAQPAGGSPADAGHSWHEDEDSD